MANMNYVDSLDIFGVPVKENPCIKGSGAPTESTVADVGFFYMDTLTGDVWKCVAVDKIAGKYIWTPFNIDTNLNYVTPQMFGAKGDGVTDDTEAIQAALDASSMVYIPDGVYMVNATQSPNNPLEGGLHPNTDQIIILSNNALLKAITNSTGHYSVINMCNVNNVYINGGKIEGDNDTHDGTDGEFGYGISILACSNITLNRIEISKCWGDSIFVGYFNEVDSANIRVYNCVLHDSRRQGISIVGCSDIIVTDCKIYNIIGTTPQYGIDIEPDGTGKVNNVIIENCYIHSNGVGSIVMANTDNELKNVRIVGCTLDDLNCSGGEGIIVDNCRIDKMFGASSPYRIVCSNSFIGYVWAAGSDVVFNNCDFENNTYDVVITSSLDRHPEQISNMFFNDCRFKTVSGTRYLMELVHIDQSVTVWPDSVISFSNCLIDFVENCQLSNRVAGNEMRFENCKLMFDWTPWNVFPSMYASGAKVIIKNTEVACPGSPDYLITVSEEASIEISNSKLPNNKYFVYASDRAGGKIRIINSEMGSTNIIGEHNFTEVHFANSSNTEEWVFTLEDGSTVIKKVVLA